MVRYFLQIAIGGKLVNLKLFLFGRKKKNKKTKQKRLSAATNFCLVMIYLSWLVDNEGRK